VWREHTITQLAVPGSIPAHLDGRYLRNGPNPITEFIFIPHAPQAPEDAAIHLPYRVPYGFYGNWVPAAS